MRWFWIDKFTEFESGRRATAVKNVSLAEEHLHDHFPAAPIMPNSLIIEGMAQTGGLLVGEHNGFAHQVVLAKLAKVHFHFEAVPGDTLVYEAVIDDIQHDGARVTTRSHVGNRLQAEAEIFFAHLDWREGKTTLFEPALLLGWLRITGVYNVGRAPDGSPLQLPPLLAPVATQTR